MPSIFDALQNELSGDSLSALAGTLGADTSMTQSAVAAALPLLLGALTKNASTPSGAQSLAGALDRDHAQPLSSQSAAFGGLGGLLSAALSSGGPKSLDGAGILGHLLGGQKQSAVESVAKQSGLDTGTVVKLLAALAPVVMSSLGTVKKQRNLDAGGLSGYLNEQTQQIPGAGGGLLGGLTDPGADGVGIDDLVRMGGMLQKSGILGKLF